MDRIDITHLVTNDAEQKESGRYFLDLSNMPDFAKHIIEEAIKNYTTVTKNENMNEGQNLK
jgi:hypothetical protein